jgi:hypothetical protein
MNAQELSRLSLVGAFIKFTQAPHMLSNEHTSYFLWDTLDAIVNFVDISFVLHGMFLPDDQASPIS